jgi:Ca2+:H+ antiporter
MKLSASKAVYGLLVFVPISIALSLAGHGNTVIAFVSASLAIIPLAGMLGRCTEEVACRTGAMLGALLNATCGNATELIIGLFALRAGQVDLVRASIAGSIIGNLLLVLGASILAGGLRFKIQKFNQDHAESGAINLLLCTLSITLPAIFAAAHGGTGKLPQLPLINLSVAVAIILLSLYLMSLFFAYRRQEEVISNASTSVVSEATWPLKKSVGLLVFAAALIGYESEILVGSVNQTAEMLGLNKVFIGLIIVSIVGNAAEHATAVVLALKNKMDLSMNIAIGSSTQIAMFVAPVLVLCSLWLGHPMTFLFSITELTAIAFSVLIVAFIAGDGKCHWLEGAQMLAAYAIISMAFLFLP